MYRNVENANFQLLHDLAQKVVEEKMVVTHNSSQFLPVHNNNSNIYQNYYVPTSRTDLMQSYDQMPNLATVQETSNSSLHFSNNFNMEQDQQPSNNFELMAQLAADLVNVTTPSVNNVNYEANECVYLKNYKEQQERILLHSTMSPLLAAVNDITKRDAELQLYLNQNFEKQHELLSPPELGNSSDNEKEIDEADTTSTIIVDKPVLCRAKASLPTRYLRLGEVNDLTNEPIVIAKKSITHPTKFGPVEGVVRYVSTIDLDVLHIQVPRFFPLLLVDESHTLDVSNEDSSNWMRYIRLAESSTVQNLHVLLENGRIYYRTTRNIKPQEELRVGYSAVYGARFMLPVLPIMAMKLATNPENVTHSRLRPKNIKENIMPRTAKSKRKLTARQKKKLAASRSSLKKARCQKQFKERSRAVSKIRKEVMQHLRKLCFKCDLCAKRFSDLPQMEKHKLKHIEEPARKHVCHICQQKCATPTALESHIKGHMHISFTCIYCANEFLNVRIFAKHVATHKVEDGRFCCTHCKKLYTTYALVRKHVRLFHNVERNFACSECKKKFPCLSELKRHEGTHGKKKSHVCTECQQTFLRRDQLVVHQRQVHGNETVKNDTTFNKMENVEVIIKKLSNRNDATAEKKSVQEQYKNQLALKEQAVVGELENKSNDLIKTCPIKLDKNMPNIFTASSSNRRKQTPTKLKTLEQKFDTLDYVPLSELLTPYLMSEQELHEEFEKAEIEATLPSSTNNNKLDMEKQAENQVKPFKLKDKSTANSIERQSSDTESNVADTTAKFICHLCPNSKFKRRGILVNHMTKMHPTIDLDNIESLNTPIIKQQLVYKCCYCKNVYKSAAKRKVHIMRHHPGSDIPSCKDKENPLHVEAVGNKEEEIHKCQLCSRQYAARSCLVTHYRKAHVGVEPPPRTLAQSENPQIYEEPLLISELNMMTAYQPASTSPENKLLKLSSAALELSRYDFLNERSADDYQRLPALFDETPLVGIDGLMERYNHRSIEVQFFEKIGKL